MKRDILCPACGEKSELHPLDKHHGFKQRKVAISARRPEDHGIWINDKFIPHANMNCDHCNEVILEGAPAVAVTIWNGPTEPPNWEKEYMHEAVS
jgi:hypothetical protein